MLMHRAQGLPQWRINRQIRIKYPIKSISYMLLILLGILYLFDFIHFFAS